MRGLYSFFWDCGRMGDVSGLFVADNEAILNSIGKHVNLGEALGKHSEIYGELGQEDLTLLSCDQDKIDWLIGLTGKTICGYNPLDFIDESEVDE